MGRAPWSGQHPVRLHIPKASPVKISCSSSIRMVNDYPMRYKQGIFDVCCSALNIFWKVSCTHFVNGKPKLWLSSQEHVKGLPKTTLLHKHHTSTYYLVMHLVMYGWLQATNLPYRYSFWQASALALLLVPTSAWRTYSPDIIILNNKSSLLPVSTCIGLTKTKQYWFQQRTAQALRVFPRHKTRTLIRS